MKILGISAFYHDAAAALIDGGEILAAAQEERFTRRKHDPSFPANAVEFCLDSTGTALDDIEAVAFYDKPFLKFERLLETYYGFAPRGLRSFLAAMPVWIREKVLLRRLLHQELSRIGGLKINDLPPLLFPEHHLSHAASAFFPSPFREAAILTVDGVGEWATASICHGEENGITILRELRFPHSLGLLYSAFTYYLGFRVNSGEYKLMGLAPYGDPTADRTARFERIIRETLVDIADDGSLWLNQDLFDYATGLRMARDPSWARLFGFSRREMEGEISQEHCDLALAIQRVTEDAVLAMAAEARRLTGSANLCLAGGVALNCVANGKLLRGGLFDGIWIQPAAGDAGGALGAALAAHHIGKGHPRTADGDRMRGSYLGPAYGDAEIRKVVGKYKAVGHRFDDYGELCHEVALILGAGNTVGWLRGRMEWGPRALGNRSILADPRNPEIQRKLNLKIKYRESFRPFAPSVLAEACPEYFELDVPSPYMLLVADVRDSRRNPLPEGYHALPLREKLYHQRSDIPAVTHLDYSARVQTVHRETNPDYWRLIEAFRAATGCAVVVNTSFNVRGEPIVCTPEDAYRCFMRTEMDHLVLENWIFAKPDQPEWREGREWKQSLVMD